MIKAVIFDMGVPYDEFIMYWRSIENDRTRGIDKPLDVIELIY